MPSMRLSVEAYAGVIGDVTADTDRLAEAVAASPVPFGVLAGAASPVPFGVLAGAASPVPFGVLAGAASPVPFGVLADAASPMPWGQAGRATAELSPRAFLKVVPAAGHFPWFEQPGCVRAALARLIPAPAAA